MVEDSFPNGRPPLEKAGVEYGKPERVRTAVRHMIRKDHHGKRHKGGHAENADHGFHPLAIQYRRSDPDKQYGDFDHRTDFDG